MPSPFPGMDPYLESPHLWPDVHLGLISQTQATLNQTVREQYVVRVEMRVYVSDADDPAREYMIPDVRVEKSKRKRGKKTKATPAVAIAEPQIVPFLIDEEIEEARLEVKYLPTGALVTVIEILSPSNKIRGARGRASFMEKHQETLASEVHWIEIDLLRGGAPSVPRLTPSDYRILVSRAENRAKARYWPVNLREPLPVIGIPLRAPDADVPLDLGKVLQTAYDRAAYDRTIDYREAPDPPLKADDQAWADQLLRDHGMR
jgi:hypothetical protein